jgi:hypothetical protein
VQAQSHKLLQVCPAWFSSIRVQGHVPGATQGAPNQQQQFAVEFLTDAAFHGNFYLHGILFQKLDGLVGMGINYCGSTQLLMKYELNRDRNSADISKLVSWLVLQALELLHAEAAPSGPFLQTPDGRLAFLVVQLYLALSHQHAYNHGAPLALLGYAYSAAYAYSYKWTSAEQQQFKLLANLLVGLLGVTEGVLDKFPVPVKPTTSPEDVAELRLLGHTPVQVCRD